jgi:hypothetical protein
MGKTALDEDLRLIEGAGHGLIRTSLAREFAVSDKVLHRLERDGLVVQLTPGVYAKATTFVAADSWGQFALRSRAWALAGRNDGHACDFSAAAVLGIPMWGQPPSLPRVLRPGSAHRGHSRTPYGRIRYGWLSPRDRWTFHGVPVTSVAYASIDVMRMGSRLQGLTVADYALALGVSRELLAQIADDLALYKGIAAANWAIAHADRRSESPLETAGRLACLAYDLPTAIPNAWVTGGSSPRRVDLLLPDHGIVLEADGALKYDNRPDASQVIMSQGERELELRELGFEVLRFDARLAVARPAQLAGRVRKAMSRRRGQPAPGCWAIDPPTGVPTQPALGAGWPVPGFTSLI